MKPTGLLQQIRERTRESHARLEALPFHRALLDSTLDRVSIHSYFRSLAIILTALQSKLTETQDSRLSALVEGRAHMLELINKDLELIFSNDRQVVTAAIDAAVEMAHSIRKLNRAEELFIAGVLYVTEGSQNGASLLKSAIAKSLSVSPDQVSYFGAYGTNTREVWSKFTTLLDSLEFSSTEENLIIDGAVQTFAMFERVMATLHPHRPRDLSFHASSINPEAGSHAVPQTATEIEIAFEAGKKAWTGFPYLEERFKDRGKRFTASDSCWLVSLFPLEETAIRKNIFWLRGVLSARGLPSIILETHLKEIVSLARARLSYSPETYLGYSNVVNELRMNRLQSLSEDQWNTMANDYDRQFSECDGYKVTRPSSLVMSAWFDEMSGIRGANLAIENWFGDPSRFSARWIALMQNLKKALDNRHD